MAKEVLEMSEADFITHIVVTICDYAKANNYEITETIKTMGETLVALTEIGDFDNWKAGGVNE